MDGNGELIDTEQKNMYSLVIRPKGNTTFKVSIQREFPKEQYVGHAIRIVSAIDARYD
jgi:hypothetical protein